MKLLQINCRHPRIIKSFRPSLPGLLQKWKQHSEAESEDTTLTEDERMEMARLRTENRRLRMERDILKKAAAFFANEKS